jgi:ABC-type multidrug transport system fused ATPase/permease subunit
LCVESVLMKNDILRALGLLTKFERRKVTCISSLQVLTSCLDLFGILLAGLIAGVALERDNSGPLTQNISKFFTRFYFNPLPWTSLLGFLILAALILLATKSITNIVLSRSLYTALADSLSRIAKETFQKVLLSKYLYVKQMKTQEVGYALTDGLTFLVIGIVGSFLTGIAEMSLLVLILLGLIWLNPIMAIGATIFFALLALFISFFVGRRVKDYGSGYMKSTNESRTTLIDALHLYREINLSGAGDFFSERFSKSRSISAFSYSRLYWLQQVPKYIMELGIILGATLLAALSWFSSNSTAGVTSLAVFLMASTRVVPSILRLQGVYLSLREFSGKSEVIFSLLTEISELNEFVTHNENVIANTISTPPTICLSGVAFSYDKESAIRDVNLSIVAGSEVTFMGPSGSGKSTICELILGLLTPSKGAVTYDGLSISDWRNQFGASIAYLPQDPHYFGGTIRENVTLSSVRNGDPDEGVWKSLEFAQIADFVKSLPLGLETELSDRGLQLSGGQRQRIGIARTLYHQPKVLVIDEGTSALDHETDYALVQMFSLLKGKSTVIRVTHRITANTSEQLVAYVENGSIREFGTIAQIRQKLPTFEASISSNI